MITITRMHEATPMMRKRRWLWGLSLGTLAVLVSPAAAAPGPAASEAELLAVLRSDAPEADKAITCKFLAVNGSAAAVADLAGLLSNPRLASWARIALEAIPGAEASAALREAAGRLDGRLLAGVLTSLGVRGDTAAVPMLASRLSAEDAEVAAAAAWALGKIASPEAGLLLAGAMEETGSRERLDDLARAAVLCAARLTAAGRGDEAVALYGVVRVAEVNEQRRAEAIRGTIIAKGMGGVALLVETLRSPVRRLANMAIFTARDLGRGEDADPRLAAAVDEALVTEFDLAAAEGSLRRAAILIDVLAERNAGQVSDPVLAALAKAAGAGAKPIRLAAIEALGTTGAAAAVGPLLAVVADEDPGIADTARAAVAALAGGAVDRELTARLATADAATLPAIVEIVGRRRIDALEDLLPLVEHPDPGVRVAAIVALGPTVDLEHLDVLLEAATRPRSDAEAEVARAALREASVRMPDREACGTMLAAAVDAAPAEAKTMLLEVLAEVGGTRAVETMAAAGRSGERSLEDTATRLLGKWMTADAAAVLLEIATAQPPGPFAKRALRGYLRIARQFVMPDAERAEMCRRALAAATDADDRAAVLQILTRYPSGATLAVAEEAATVPALEAAARQAADEIRGKLKPARPARKEPAEKAE